MVPFHSIEAWLFQNTRLGRRLCQDNQACSREDAGRFDEWERNPALLDEILTPKKKICFKDANNRRLAESLDVDALYYVGKSFHDVVEAFARSGALIQALAATRPEADSKP